MYHVAAGDSDNCDDDDMLMICSEYDENKAHLDKNKSEVYFTPPTPVKKDPSCLVTETPSALSPSGSGSTKKILVLLNDLQTAIIKGDESYVTETLKKFSTLVNTPLVTGWPPLHYATRFGRVGLVRILLEAGADPNQKSQPDGVVAAMLACSCSDADKALDSLKLLREYKADFVVMDSNSKSVLSHAVKSRHSKLVEFLVDAEPELVNSKDFSGWTALDWAVSKQEIDIVRLLINHGASVLSFSEHVSLDKEIEEILKEKGLANLPPKQDTPTASNITREDSESGFTSASEGNKSQIENILVKPIAAQENNPLIIRLSEDQHDFQLVKEDEDDKATNENEEIVISHPSLPNETVCKNYGKIELLLGGLDLEYLVSVFHEHDVKFEQFLYLSMEDLITIGVEKLGARKRILKAIKDWHVTEWDENSLPKFHDVNLTFEDISDILSTSSDHVVYISSALRYVKNHISTSPDILVPSGSCSYTKDPQVTVREQTADLFEASYELCKSLKYLQSHIDECVPTDDQKLAQADLIRCADERNYCYYGGSKTTAVTCLLLPVAITVCLLKHRSILAHVRRAFHF